MRERYSTEELDRALAHAASFGALDHASVERILVARAMPRTLDEYVAEETARRIATTLGHVRTEPRDLAEYDRLPITRSRAQETPTCPSETESNETTTPSSCPDSDDTSRSSD
jgi:hypothetical protein